MAGFFLVPLQFVSSKFHVGVCVFVLQVLTKVLEEKNHLREELDEANNRLKDMLSNSEGTDPAATLSPDTSVLCPAS